MQLITQITRNIALTILDDNDSETQPNKNIDNCLLMINNDDKCDDTDAYKPNKTDDVKIINDHLQVSILLYLTILEICLNRDKYLNLQQKSFQNNVETLIDKYLYCIF